MTVEEFFELVIGTEINNKKREEIEKIYETSFDEYINKIISIAEESIFIDKEKRLISYVEIKNASEEYGVDFISKQILPLFDCYDNDFIVYCYDKKIWALYNIIDDLNDEEKSLEKLL